MPDITRLAISYPDFKLQEIIDPDQFDLNNKDIVDKINEVLGVVNGQVTSIDNVKTVLLPLKADKTYVDAQVAGVQGQITTNKTAGDLRYGWLDARVVSNEATLSLWTTKKADKTYVDAQIALIQSGYIADNSVTTGKLVDGAVTGVKLANATVTENKVDGVTVYSATQVNARIKVDVDVAKAGLQAQLDTNKNNIQSNNASIAYTNTRIDNLQYNKDLYSAKQDIIVLAINLELLRGADLTGVNQNMVLETLATNLDINILNGVYNQGARKVFIP